MEENLRVCCLQNFLDLHKACEKEQIKMSEDSRNFALYSILVNLGVAKVQSMVKQLVAQGCLKWDQEEDFEVEAILDYVKEDEQELYLIKWKGWSYRHNTWEPKKHLTCPDLLEKFHEYFEAGYTKTMLHQKLSAISNDNESASSKQKILDIYKRLCNENISLVKLSEAIKGSVRNINHSKDPSTLVPRKKLVARRTSHVTNKRSKAYRMLKDEVTAALKEWEKQLNAIQTDPAPIYVENLVDLEGPPDNFEYINDYMAGTGITIPQDPIVGCECENCFSEKKTCCSANAGGEFSYYKNKRVRVPAGTPIYECNRRCQCSSECPNRVVQLGRRHKVCLFRTANGRGWGLKALQRIPKGSFVVEYVGEVITNEEAERRGKIYDAAGRTYLFDLDYNDGDCPFTVDAGYYGNISHFINHSCDPNLAVYGVWINTLDPRLPRIALFAKEDIAKGEELTFDYLMTGDTTSGIGSHMKSEASSEDQCDELSSDMSEPAKLTDQTSKATSSDCMDGVEESGEEAILDMPPTPPPSVSLVPTSQNRIVCQCGAKTCRGYLY